MRQPVVSSPYEATVARAGAVAGAMPYGPLAFAMPCAPVVGAMPYGPLAFVGP
jgi:hypothetical protein